MAKRTVLANQTKGLLSGERGVLIMPKSVNQVRKQHL